MILIPQRVQLGSPSDQHWVGTLHGTPSAPPEDPTERTPSHHQTPGGELSAGSWGEASDLVILWAHCRWLEPPVSGGEAATAVGPWPCPSVGPIAVLPTPTPTRAVEFIFQSAACRLGVDGIQLFPSWS